MAKEAYDWYEEQLPGLGNRFLGELDTCFNKLEKQPLLYAKIKNNFRQVLFASFPFEIIKDGVVVYAVFHTSQSLKKKFRK
ncbi:hypothetical protein R1T15_17715 [Mucilaginibacter sp. L3T2-6]|nr:hypothetical protein [Mucilaginibacter sp. L3T2-6]MDV6216359.1 hypothetical protein [Mucilaginibacter sp. L3T2-6]